MSGWKDLNLRSSGSRPDALDQTKPHPVVRARSSVERIERFLTLLALPIV